MKRAEFGSAIQSSLVGTLRSLGEDSLTSVLSLLDDGKETAVDDLISRLGEVDAVLDELFGKFSKIIKHVTILEACSQLNLVPPKLGSSLFWMVQELRASIWEVRK